MTIKELEAVYSRLDDPGIYPQSFTDKKGNTLKRTEWQDGWNKALIAHSELNEKVWQELKQEILSTGTVAPKPEEQY